MTTVEESTPTIRDVGKLTAWMDAQGLGAGAPLEHRYISGGSQNEIYELRRGDLHCMYRHGAPAQLAALLDWEMGTVGDPKLDLAWVVHAWPTNPDEPQAIRYVDYQGMPTKSELLQRYVEVSGRQVDDIDYYCVLAKWKLAVILEQTTSRGGAKGEAFAPIVKDLMAEAGEFAATTDYAR